MGDDPEATQPLPVPPRPGGPAGLGPVPVRPPGPPRSGGGVPPPPAPLPDAPQRPAGDGSPAAWSQGPGPAPPAGAPGAHLPPGPRRRRRRFATLTTQTVVITCVVALISGLTTVAIAWPLANQMMYDDAREALAARADFVADLMRTRPRRQGKADLAKKLRREGVKVVLIIKGKPDLPNILPSEVVERLARHHEPVSTTISGADGERVLVEGRTLETERYANLGWGVVVYEPLDASTGSDVLSRLVLALPLGLLAGIGAGFLLARRVVRPLRRVALAAQRMSGGERDVSLPVESPAEVADLSRALNELNRALVASEDQQRAFLMSVSHELRTPMTTIQGYAEAIADGVLPVDLGRESGRIMLAEAARLDRLVADLLALARLRAQEFRVEMVVVDLVAVVDGAATAWQPKCRELGVELRAELSPGAVWAYTDPGRIRQVIDILVENALRLVPSGAPIVLSARADNHLAVAEVRDGGPGLTDQDLAVAFEQGALNRRYQGVRRVGTGLGLALAQQLITRLGGRIEAGHAPEGGARFTFQLPLRFH